MSFIGFWSTFEFSFPYHIFALPWLSTTCQDSLRSDYVTSLLSRPLELSKGETHFNLSYFHEYLWKQARSEYSLDFCVSQMVSVHVAGEWCLLIILRQVPQERIQELQGHIFFPETEERADSTVSMSLLRDYAQSFCKGYIFMLHIFTSVSHSPAYRVYFDWYLLACTSYESYDWVFQFILFTQCKYTSILFLPTHFSGHISSVNW